MDFEVREEEGLWYVYAVEGEKLLVCTSKEIAEKVCTLANALMLGWPESETLN